MLTKTLAAISGALTLTVLLAAPASAQNDTGTGHGPASSETISAPSSRVTPSRMDRQREAAERRRRAQQPAAPAPSDAEVRAAVQGHLTTLGNTCQMTEAKLLGQAPDKSSMYEIACATGPGYIVLGSTPPSATDCLVLASSADAARAKDPAADVGTQCALPANNNGPAVFEAYAREAGMDCQIDGAAIVGAAADGAIVYEIGCANADGARIQKSASGWERSPCFELASINATCQFTQPAEQAATLKSWLAGSEAASCDVQQARFMGQNANGKFYEATCAGADGIITRIDTQGAVQQVYPCAEAARIGGGCKLTTTPPAAAPQA